MTIKGGTTQACAACKYQRRKCSRECPLAPFFPSDRPQRFQHAHRLFGVRNILNILKVVSPCQRQDAMTSIIYESDMRKQFPVQGCVGIINVLQTQIDQMQEEIHAIQSKILLFKQQQQQQHQQQIIPFSSSTPDDDHHHYNNLQLATTTVTSNDHNTVLDQLQHVHIDHDHHHNQYNDTTPTGVYFSNYDFLTEENDKVDGVSTGIDGTDLDHNNQDPGHYKEMMKMHQHYHQQSDLINPSSLIDMNEIAPPAHLRPTLFFVPSPQDQHDQEEVDLCYDDQCTAAFDNIVDDRQSFIESKGPCESSAESSMKHATQYVKNEHNY
ncbi:LOB domain-containing protein 27-like [Humulus lupulus]|uniref:LOB domain-containing protein 27-like n=1 Tax=Humulus lupulus TaxID=3486 RepID=UPI002B40CA8A|nr:LOB domain-containing protein 27-like [Humulus lupulus]